jgi:hypothetical protein
MGSKGQIPAEMSQSLLTNKKQGNLSSKAISILGDSPNKPSLFKDFAAFFCLTVFCKALATVLTQLYSPFLVMKEWKKL